MDNDFNISRKADIFREDGTELPIKALFFSYYRRKPAEHPNLFTQAYHHFIELVKIGCELA